MKKIIFCILFFAIYAAANSCTKAWFEINAYEYFASSDRPYLDSTHQNELTYEIDEKYVYKNGLIDSILTYHQKSTTPNYLDTYNWSEGKLISNGSVVYLSREIINDTLIITQTAYLKDRSTNQITTKILDNYAEKKIVKSSSGKEHLQQIFFSNDTLVFQTTTTKSGETDTYKKITVDDPQDDSKCTEFNYDGEIDGQLEFTKTNNGYTLTYNEENYAPKSIPNYKEYFMVVPKQYTTTIRKKRTTIKATQKATYFDLLGRYKFTK